MAFDINKLKEQFKFDQQFGGSNKNFNTESINQADLPEGLEKLAHFFSGLKPDEAKRLGKLLGIQVNVTELGPGRTALAMQVDADKLGLSKEQLDELFDFDSEQKSKESELNKNGRAAVEAVYNLLPDPSRLEFYEAAKLIMEIDGKWERLPARERTREFSDSKYAEWDARLRKELFLAGRAAGLPTPTFDEFKRAFFFLQTDPRIPESLRPPDFAHLKPQELEREYQRFRIQDLKLFITFAQAVREVLDKHGSLGLPNEHSQRAA